MSQFIDRRKNGSKKSTVNRQRFIQRYKSQIKQAVTDSASKRSITNIDKGESISIPAKDTHEPHFHRGEGGNQEYILPGNDQFIAGDKVARPSKKGASGQGSEASNQGEGEDDFVFELSREEFLDLYFEDLELPDLVKKELAKLKNYKVQRAGITSSGTPTNIHVLRSMKQATSRRIAISAKNKRTLAMAEDELAGLLKKRPKNQAAIEALQEEIAALKHRLAKVPFIDTLDLRYHYRTRIALPATQAVMFCVMDVSGSMDEAKKDIAKRFFILLYLFLRRNYEKIDLVFIRHHTSAKEVTEEEFFYSRETGGTVVSSALELLAQIIESRYPSDSWNIYAAQASDGDNWNADSPYCLNLLQERILPLLQYFAYIEIMPRQHQSLWEAYQKALDQHSNFAMQPISAAADIYPVFRELFKRKGL